MEWMNEWMNEWSAFKNRDLAIKSFRLTFFFTAGNK